MKETYTRAEMEIELFGVEDIIRTSSQKPTIDPEEELETPTMPLF